MYVDANYFLKRAMVFGSKSFIIGKNDIINCKKKKIEKENEKKK